MTQPIAARYNGTGFDLLPRFQRIADERFVIGQIYTLEEREERSSASHRHFFACVREAWANLPEEYDGRWATDTHLRKWALIQVGYRDEETIVCGSKAEALRLSAMVKRLDDFSVVVVRDAVVTVLRAKSMSQKAMDKATFQKAKDAVLSMLSTMIGTTPAQLERAAA